MNTLRFERLARLIEAEADKIENGPIVVSWFGEREDISHYNGQAEGLRQAARMVREDAAEGRPAAHGADGGAITWERYNQ